LIYYVKCFTHCKNVSNKFAAADSTGMCPAILLEEGTGLVECSDMHTGTYLLTFRCKEMLLYLPCPVSTLATLQVKTTHASETATDIVTVGGPAGLLHIQTLR
jgi:hypothetical protein